MIGEKIFCGLDIGSEKIKAALLKVRNSEEIELIGAFINNTYGFKGSSVNNLGDFTECIFNTLNHLSQRTGYKIKEVQLGLSAGIVDTRITSAAIPLMDRWNKIINRVDVQKINKQARLLGINIKEEILHDFPQNYIIDDTNCSLNPVGLYGRKMEVNSLLFIVNSDQIQNIIKAVNQSGYNIENIFFNTFAASDICLDEQSKTLGCVLIDIGAAVTSVLIFKDKVLKFISKIGIGGEDFTNSISQKLNLSFDLAEEIKESYGSAITSEEHKEEEILIKESDRYIPIKRKDIIEAIEPKIKELIDNIKEVINKSGLELQIPKGIILIGGGALLSGLIERIGQETNLPVNLGNINIAAHKQIQTSALFLSAFGLANYAYKKKCGNLQGENAKSGIIGRMTNKLLDIYQEYF